eukprot:SAG31_NODE_3696_length_3980_cov_1.437001_2_plen_258_part_00
MLALTEAAAYYEDGDDASQKLTLGSLDIKSAAAALPVKKGRRSIDNAPPTLAPATDGRAFAVAMQLGRVHLQSVPTAKLHLLNDTGTTTSGIDRLQRPQYWFFAVPKGEGSAGAIGLHPSKSSVRNGPRLDADTAAERLFSQLLLAGQPVDLVPPEAGGVVTVDHVLSVMSMKCKIMQFAPQQVATIKLHQGLLTQPLAELRTHLRAGAELNPLDQNTGMSAAESAISHGEIDRLQVRQRVRGTLLSRCPAALIAVL